MMKATFETPEAAALAEWPAEAQPVIVSVETRRDRAEVVVEVNSGYRYWTYLRRHGDGWIEVNSGNGPNAVYWDEEQADG
jgi:hypothetical protein